MKKCLHTLSLKDNKGFVKWELCDRKKRVCLAFIDYMLEKGWLRTETSKEEDLTLLIQYLQSKPNWGWSLLRARLRGDKL
jgi:hypothetical protein